MNKYKIIIIKTTTPRHMETYSWGCIYQIPVILVELEGFQLEVQFVLVAPRHEVRLGSRHH